MVEIGGRPILWHIMKHYAHYGHKEFYIALGYKGNIIKHFFTEYAEFCSNMTVNLSSGQIRRFGDADEDWIVNLVDTGLDTNTGGRLLRLEPWLRNEPFFLTYGDGVSNVDLDALVRFDKGRNRLATLTAVRPPARFGGVLFQGDLVDKFTEKPQIGEGWINGGFFVFHPGIFEYLDNDKTSLESHGLEKLAADKQLAAYRHEDFWQCMDTLRDKRQLEDLWERGKAPWKVWP
jgi:glucose-1-phosphate cytidylyltransferase